MFWKRKKKPVYSGIRFTHNDCERKVIFNWKGDIIRVTYSVKTVNSKEDGRGNTEYMWRINKNEEFVDSKYSYSIGVDVPEQEIIATLMPTLCRLYNEEVAKDCFEFLWQVKRYY